MTTPQRDGLAAIRPRRARRAGIPGIAALAVIAGAFVGIAWWSDNWGPGAGPGAAIGSNPLVPHTSPRPVADVTFQDGDGRNVSLAAFRGKVVLLNVWATWCAPCRKEMPTLDRLQARLRGNAFEVVALSIDRGGLAAVKGFYDEIDVKALAVYVDPTTEAQAKLGVIGVPTTLLLDREGREVARYTGPAQWDGAGVIAAIGRYLPPGRS